VCVCVCVQDVADDADAPHVGAEVNRFILDDLRSHELRCAEQDTRVDRRTVDASEAKVNDLDAISTPRHAQDVLRLQPAQHWLLGVDHRMNQVTLR